MPVLTCHEPGKAAIALSSTTHILHSALYRGETQIVLAVQDRIHPGDFLIIQTDVGSYHRVAGNINNRHGAKENEALIELRS